MAKLPSMQFYPGDWLKDPALRACSPAARGVWIDLLCLMFESPQRGVLRLKRTKNEQKTNAFCSKNGAISIKNVAKMIHGCRPKMIHELIENGVVRVARKDGALYSKRLVRDELRRRHLSHRGAAGGRAKSLLNLCQISAKPVLKRGSSSSSSFSTTKEKKGFSESLGGEKQSPISTIEVFPLPGGLICSTEHCGCPAISKSTGGSFEHYYCKEHLPEKRKERMRQQGYNI